MTNTFKKSFLLFAAVMMASSLFAAGTNPKSISAGDQYFSAYKEAKTNLASNDWVSTSGSPGNSGSSYNAPSGWLSGGSGQPGYGIMNVQDTKTITFTVTNITSVSILGAANSSSRTINLSVKTGGQEVGTVATKSGSSIQVIDYASTLDPSKIYSVTISASTANNAKFYQIKFVGGSGGGGGTTPVTPTVSSVTVAPATATMNPNDTQQLTATVAVTPSTADQTVTWTSSNPNVATVNASGLVTAVAQGSATITATSNLDNTKSGTCAVTVNAPAAPVPVTAIALNKATTTIAIGSSETLTINYTPTDANTGKAVNWTSSNQSVATVDNSGKVTGVAAGTATITAISTTDNSITASCTVTVEAVAVTGITLNPTTANVQVNGTTTLTASVQPTNATNKNVTWSTGDANIATVSNGVVTGVAAGQTTITATTTDGNKTATCNVTVTAGPPVPSTNLTLHVPEIYEAKEIAGGYNGTLSVVNGREYEVYYASFTEEGELSVTVTPVQKSNGITTPLSDYHCKAKDGWLEMETSTSKSNYTMSAIEEFAAGSSAVHKLLNNAYYKMHIKGFDQFSFYGKDNNETESKGKHFEVYIDNVKQPMNLASSATIRRFDISTGEHVIEVRGVGASNNEFYGFSLRLAQEPRTKWLKGNDSAQVVMQTTAIKPLTYVTKYNNIPGAETKLIWDGPEATGIGLTKIPGTLSDTLVLSGNANCPTGLYKYVIAAYYNGAETNRASGKFTVGSTIKAKTDVNAYAYTNEEMDQITFTYYALSADSVQLSWPNGQPAGISGSGNNGKYIIGGTPTAATGTYPYSITTAGGDTTITGTITISTLNYGPKSVLYLYKNNQAFDRNGVYQALNGTGSNQWDLIARKQKEDGLRPATQYANYKWILISEDVDANNLEVLNIIRGGSNLPVLNMKGFTYSQDRLGWGDPNNGAIDTMSTKSKGTELYIEQPTHPVFANLGSSLKKGDSIKIISDYEQNGLMPIDINLPGTYCLATAYTRDINNYYESGALQTALHEVPADMDMRNGHKYICLPMAGNVTLTPQGKNLLNGIISYLLSPTPASLTTPELRITKFIVGDVEAVINETEKTIKLQLTKAQYDEMDLTAAKPKITLADPVYSRVTPASNEEVNLQYATIPTLSKAFVVSDFINRVVYQFMIQLINPQDIEEVYEIGQWVNIFDIYGRKVTTTNEDIYTMDLPHGMYIVVTENGNTLKIMR